MKDLRARPAAEDLAVDAADSSGSSGRWYFDATHLRLDGVNSRIAFDSVPVAIALCDLGGRLVHANRAFQEMLSLDTLEGVGNQGIVELLHDGLPADDVEALARDGRPLARVLERAAGGPAARMLCHGRRVAGDGQVPRWLVFSFSVFDAAVVAGDSGGQPFIDWAATDAVVGAARWQVRVTDATVLVDAEMRWSGGMTGLLGLAADAGGATPRQWLRKIAPADRMRMADNLHRLARNGTAFEDEYRIAAQGERRVRVIQSRACRIALPEVPGGYVLVGMEQDVTDRRHADQQRRYALEAFRAIVESSELPMCAVDRRLHLVVANGAFRAVVQNSFGTSADEGFELRSVLAEAGVRRRIIFNLRRALDGQRRVEATVFRDANGLRTTYDLAYNPVTLQDGTVIGVAVCSTAIRVADPAAGPLRDTRQSGRRRPA